MNYEVTHAYHVTNRLADDAYPPDWRCLRTSPAPDEHFDGPLFDLDLDGVFLTTTLRCGNLPTRTIYPIGGLAGDDYWRVSVPLTRFNNKRVFRVHEHCNDNGGPSQVLLLLADNNYSKIIDHILMYPDVEELSGYYGDNAFLFRDDVTKNWYSNNFDRRDPYWVNIFVPHRVRLGFDCEWDTVQHY